MNLDGLFIYLSNFLIIIPLALFCLFPVLEHLKHSLTNVLLKMGLAFLCYFLLLIIPYFLSKGDLGNILLFLSVPAFFYLFQREVDILPSASLFIMMTACCLGATSYIVYHSCGMILHPHGYYNDNYIESLIAQLVFLIFADVLLFHPVKKYLGWMVSNYHSAFTWRIASIFPGFFTLIAITYIPYDYYDMYTSHALHVYFSMILTLFMFIILLYILFYKITYSYVENNRILEEQKILEIQAQQYSQLSQHVQQTREIRHDFRHQIAVISELLNQQHYDELKDYLSQYESSISSQAKLYCQQSAVNALLTHYDFLCEQDGIQTRFAVDFPMTFTISSVDFCIILGNL